ncbi:MAG: LON peptidase substrate-binding domain-containing protein [Neomegalonema sp.]|nr:LON peptidase substrate-binding domain-containing protein [Neomegalonema sp.]
MTKMGAPRRLAFNALPDVLPIFPLEGALLLPWARLPLNIFEPRYLAMVEDAIRTEARLIGIIQPRPSKLREAEDEETPRLYDIGCAGRITSFSETDDGRYLISLAGVLRFKVLREIEGFTPYRRVEADWTSFEGDLKPAAPGTTTDETRAEFLSLLKSYFDASSLSADWEALTRADEETLVNALAMLSNFSPQEKQALLEAPNLTERRQNLLALMRFTIAAKGGDGGATQ